MREVGGWIYFRIPQNHKNITSKLHKLILINVNHKMTTIYLNVSDGGQSSHHIDSHANLLQSKTKNRQSIRKKQYFWQLFCVCGILNAICATTIVPSYRMYVCASCSIRNGIKHASSLLFVPSTIFGSLNKHIYFPQKKFHSYIDLYSQLRLGLRESKKSVQRFNLLIANEN